jgi:hypothetical protein
MEVILSKREIVSQEVTMKGLEPEMVLRFRMGCVILRTMRTAGRQEVEHKNSHLELLMEPSKMLWGGR